MGESIGIVGNGPEELLPDFSDYQTKIDNWIGADRGAYMLLKAGIQPDYAIGDFDSVNQSVMADIKKNSSYFIKYAVEKDKTDMTLALEKAYDLEPSVIYIFGSTGGRLDHALINIQSLICMNRQNITGIIADKQNRLELVQPGQHKIHFDEDYPSISFIPYSQTVKGLTLDGFYYSLINETISWGSTRCISNMLISNYGTFSFDEGILLVIKTCES